MKVCLIRPPQLVTKLSSGNKAAAPIGIAFLGAMLQKHGHQVTLIDCIAEAPEQLECFLDGVYRNGLAPNDLMRMIPADADVIGFSLMFTMNWLHDREVIRLTREHFPNAFIIAGGEHITALPEFSIAQSHGIDVCILGEGELTLIELLEAKATRQSFELVAGIVYEEKGNYVRTAKRNRQINISELPWPAWHLLPIDMYFEHGMIFGVDRGTTRPIMASRGCPYQCTFCSSPNMWGTRYVLRTVKDVTDEIETLHKNYGVQNIDFYDLTAIIKRDWIVNFCNELISRKLNITWQLPSGTRSEAIDNEVAELMYLSGCRNVSYAPESGSPELLKVILKKVNLDKLLQSARYSVKNNLNVKVNIIVGLPEESHLHIWQTLWFLIKCSWVGINDTTPGLFYPYPGSKIFNDLKVSGNIDLNNDLYFKRLLFTDSFTNSTFTYNRNLSIGWLRFYQILMVLVFYGSNYVFRPQRFFRTVKNIITNHYESRFEMTFTDMLRKNKLAKRNRQVASTASST